MSSRTASLAASLVLIAGIACETFPPPRDPATAPRASVDRFSAQAGKLMVRTASNGLPGANQPVDFDREPFITQGVAPDGRAIRYYNFDVQSAKAAPVYLLYRQGDRESVTGQLPIIDQIPGDPGYNDFRQIVKVTVPLTYKANSITSAAEVTQHKLRVEPTGDLLNLPIVPDGSTATRRYKAGRLNLFSAWYRGQTVKFFRFDERRLSGGTSGTVPISPIFVTFMINPDQPGGGPPSGFMKDRTGVQTHNVVATVPEDAGYSPLWQVNVYDNAAFRTVGSLETAKQAKIVAAGVATVNCPIVEFVKK